MSKVPHDRAAPTANKVTLSDNEANIMKRIRQAARGDKDIVAIDKLHDELTG